MRSELERDGFVIVGSLLGATEIQSALDALETMGTDASAVRTRRGVAFARRNLLETPWVQRVLRLSTIRDLLGRLAPGLTAVRALLFDKTADANWVVPWHQDRSIAVRDQLDAPGFGPWSQKAGVVHVQPPVQWLKQMVTLRVHLDACDADNGPLLVIPATHNLLMAADEIASVSRDAQPTACTTGAGGAVMMKPLLLHASTRAKRPRRRRILHIEFGPARLPFGLEWALR